MCQIYSMSVETFAAIENEKLSVTTATACKLINDHIVSNTTFSGIKYQHVFIRMMRLL